MKGISVSIVITIIFVVLIILTIVAFVPSLKEIVVNSYCRHNFIEEVKGIVYEACEMDDVSLEDNKIIDTSCFQELRFETREDAAKLVFKLKESSKEEYVETTCPNRPYTYVSFDFSLAGDANVLKTKKNSYNFLILPKMVKLIFCQGMPDECKTFNGDENGCKKQIGCSWDQNTNTCSGNPKSCYQLNDEECKRQKGCEPV